MDFGSKVRRVRELRQMTLSDLSKQCGLSVPYLSDIENGKKRPAMKSLERLAKALNTDTWFFLDDHAVTFDDLARVSGYEPPPEITEYMSNKDNLPYIVLAKKLTDEGIPAEVFEAMIANFKLGIKYSKNQK